MLTACVVVLAGGAMMSYLLNKQPVKSPKVTTEEPAKFAGSSIPVKSPGCWDVTLDNGVELVATWNPDCPGAAPATLGDQPWLQGTIRLPALSNKEPAMAQAQPRMQLSEELAQHGVGALLFLPANTDGSGYYVAAWAVDEESEDEAAARNVKRGLQVGLYGAPPTSVATPGGRVYLSREFAPQGVRQFMASRASALRGSAAYADGDEGEDDSSPADEAAARADTASTSARESSAF
ncbi:hypothetical protein WJ84_00620 [Burkholderia ubonensis]|nr:hypothetical protein WJ84_00620 [Burkholderia ubonensis]KVP40065.1 hypothetical protein WJ87_07740 [Burkholderia ubonensis]